MAAFADAINDLLLNDLKAMGKNGKKYIYENFNWDKIANEFKDLFTQMLKTKGHN